MPYLFIRRSPRRNIETEGFYKREYYLAEKIIKKAMYIFMYVAFVIVEAEQR